MSDIVKGTGRLSFNENVVNNNGPTPSGHLPNNTSSSSDSSNVANSVSYSSVTSIQDIPVIISNNHKSPKSTPESTATIDKSNSQSTVRLKNLYQLLITYI